jgi:hypothetical protein
VASGVNTQRVPNEVKKKGITFALAHHHEGGARKSDPFAAQAKKEWVARVCQRG